MVLGPGVFRTAGLRVPLVLAGGIEFLFHFGQRALGDFEVGRQGAADAVDLIGKLLLIGRLLGGQGEDRRVAGAETGLQEAGQFGADLLVLGKNGDDRLVFNLKGRQRAHQFVTGKFFNLDVLGTEVGGHHPGFADLPFLLLQDGLLRLHGVLEAVGIEVCDAQLGTDTPHFFVGFLDLGALFGHLVFQRGEGTGQEFLLIFDPLALVFLRDAVGQIGRLLRVGALHADLQEVGITHFAHVDHAAQLEVGLLAAADTEFLAPPLKQLHRVDHRIEHLLALDDLKLGGGKPRIHSHAALIAFGENADFLLVLFDLDDDVRLVLARHEVGRDARGDHDEEEGQNDDRQPQPDNAPVVEKVQFGFLHGSSIAFAHDYLGTTQGTSPRLHCKEKLPPCPP